MLHLCHQRTAQKAFGPEPVITAARNDGSLSYHFQTASNCQLSLRLVVFIFFCRFIVTSMTCSAGNETIASSHGGGRRPECAMLDIGTSQYQDTRARLKSDCVQPGFSTERTWLRYHNQRCTLNAPAFNRLTQCIPDRPRTRRFRFQCWSEAWRRAMSIDEVGDHVALLCQHRQYITEFTLRATPMGLVSRSYIITEKDFLPCEAYAMHENIHLRSL